MTTQVARPGPVTPEIRAYGRARSAQPLELFSEVSGVIEGVDLPFRPGRRFTRGDLLLRVDDRPLRLLGVQVSRLEDVRQPVQETLFNGAMAEPSSRQDYMASAEKLAKVTPSLDKLRRKFGRGVVVPAATLDKGIPRGRDGTGAGGDASAAGAPPGPPEDLQLDE